MKKVVRLRTDIMNCSTAKQPGIRLTAAVAKKVRVRVKL